MLKEFEIGPGPVRQGEANGRGYKLEDFTDAFERYLGPAAAPVTSVTSQGGNGAAQKSLSLAGCDGRNVCNVPQEEREAAGGLCWSCGEIGRHGAACPEGSAPVPGLDE